MKRIFANICISAAIFIVLCATVIEYYSPKAIQSESVQEARKTIAVPPAKDYYLAPIYYAPQTKFGILNIPKLNVQVALVAGLGSTAETTDQRLLDQLVAHVENTKYPAENGQVYLAGHNNMALHTLDKLVKGDTIRIDLNYGSFTYIVEKSVIVSDTAIEAIQPNLKYEELVLQTCYPLTSIARNTNKRYLVYAYPIGQIPKVSLPLDTKTY